MSCYDGALTMREARIQYFSANDFGENGGYDDAWVDFKIAGFPFPFPNSPMRVKAVRYHDLHHVITEYGTNLPGELEISAWEIGAGCRSFVVAWQLNLSGTAAGAFFMPRRTLRAFLRGRRSRSLYGLDVDDLLGETVRDVRDRIGLPKSRPRASAVDLLLYALAVLSGLAIGLVTAILGLLGLPFAYLAFAKKAREARQLQSKLMIDRGQ